MKLKDLGSIDYLGMQLTLRTFVGVVRENSTRSSVHRESSHTEYGQLSSIRMVSEQHQEVWLHDDNGEEVRLGVGGLSIPMRDGHRVQAFFAARGAEQGTLVAVKNVNTGQLYETFNDYQKLPRVGFFKLPLLQTLGPGPLFSLCVVSAIIGGFVGFLAGLPFTVGLAGAGGVIAFALYRQHSKAAMKAIEVRNELSSAIRAGSGASRS
ncbi:hypothetical protein [Paraburkholderia guartelaensis]|uniref:hypothetical protein n=1 Tax=Paraburkholderia guartelaensis TaxID=2546446 RepID=UPI002AB7A26E|nr:hypothetical protein [Paraburkholderia guartelaensis]